MFDSVRWSRGTKGARTPSRNGTADFHEAAMLAIVVVNSCAITHQHCVLFAGFQSILEERIVLKSFGSKMNTCV